MPPINGEIAVWAEPTAATKPPPMDPSFYAAQTMVRCTLTATGHTSTVGNGSVRPCHAA